MTNSLPASVLTKHQVKTFGPRAIAGYGTHGQITATVRYDDQCGNGHNTFSVTATVVTATVVTAESKRQRDIAAGGCMHEEIARIFPQLAPLIKWHLVSSDGPMHYLANTRYLSGDRDHWGLKKGEFRQHTSRGKYQNEGVEGVPCWELRTPKVTEVYAEEKPAPVTMEWQPYGITGEGKELEVDAARRCAVWPEATPEQLQDESALMARLPALMAEFKAAVESLGFTY